MEAAGYFLDGEYLNEVPDSIVYTYGSGKNGSWSFRMKGSENYLAVPSAAMLLSTVTDPSAAGALWRLSWSEGAPVIKNASLANRYLQYSPSSSSFCTLQSQRNPLTLYVRVPGEHLYTSSPQAGQALPCDGGVDCPGRVFQDMPAKEHWSHDAIDWAIANRITAGTSATSFSPNDPCTRAQVVTFLWRAAGSPEPAAAENPFADVPEETYYAKPVLWAVEHRITKGSSPTSFSPDQTCTRGEFISFLYRFADSPALERTDNPFQDISEKDYYYKPILWALERRITAGTSAVSFSPKSTVTRAQVVTFLHRYLVN